MRLSHVVLKLLIVVLRVTWPQLSSFMDGLDIPLPKSNIPCLDAVVSVVASLYPTLFACLPPVNAYNGFVVLYYGRSYYLSRWVIRDGFFTVLENLELELWWWVSVESEHCGGS